MDGRYFLHGFNFHDYLLFYHQVQPISTVKFNILIYYG